MDKNGKPVSGRLRRPGWTDPRLLMGLVLVALSVAATTAVVSAADHTEPYYAARTTLTPGKVLGEGDLVVVRVRVGAGQYSTPVDSPVGMVVTRVVREGELLPLSALSSPEDFSTRPVAVSVTVPLAEGVVPGALVDVWVTEEGLAGPVSRMVASGLVVDQVSRGGGAFSAGGAETVYVMVPQHQVGALLSDLAADGEVAVVGVAGSGSP